jgi:plastocyanin
MLRRIGLITTALVLLGAASVSAATRTINVSAIAFPAHTSATIGDRVEWDNNSGFGHTVTGDSPLNLWNKNLPIGGTAARTFAPAGSYPYHCNIHATMHGSIDVAMRASPQSGTTATTFTIRWATVTAANGFKYVVQKRAPGGSFVAYKTTTTPSAAFKTGVTGNWAFRARLKRISNGAVSGFSPTLTISVTP